MTFLVALAPFFVSLLTMFVKKLKTIELSKHKKAILRFVAAVFAFGSVLIVAMLNGTEVDPVAIETFINAGMVFVSTLGIYSIGKMRRKPAPLAPTE